MDNEVEHYSLSCGDAVACKAMFHESVTPHQRRVIILRSELRLCNHSSVFALGFCRCGVILNPSLLISLCSGPIEEFAFRRSNTVGVQIAPNRSP